MPFELDPETKAELHEKYRKKQLQLKQELADLQVKLNELVNTYSELCQIHVTLRQANCHLTEYVPEMESVTENHFRMRIGTVGNPKIGYLQRTWMNLVMETGLHTTPPS